MAENWYDGLVDVIFIGEAEDTWPQFLKEWSRGLHQYRYEQIEKTDMAKVPIPRYDLVKFKEYTMGCVQTSRGCPFQCEFCDIIVIFRPQTADQDAEMVIAEIEAQRQAWGPRHLPGRRQLHRQQEGGQGDPPGDHRVAAQARLPDGLLHRGLARPGRGSTS